jgi:uncharacterized protein YjbJ (UPF0337 family)
MKIVTSDRIDCAWHQVKGKVKVHWCKLTEDHLKQLQCHAEQLAGKLQARYGWAREEAERQVKEFRKRMNWHVS